MVIGPADGTRGVIGSFRPAVYGNGARVVQTPDRAR